ncbi:MAG: glycerophosphoryl diester phosphodiesterase membrane domain-containing protein [Lachnospiraceae bacterium]|nr:glycerophosphoryl diester phosphodiesterase membrane domain-containing protein [Lachnospiraceae bacterium]
MKEVKEKPVSFIKLFLRAIPDIWYFEVVTGILVIFPMAAVGDSIRFVADSSGSAITTANILNLLSWRTVLLIILGVLLVFLSVTTEVTGPIYMSRDLISGEECRVFKILKEGFLAGKRFLNPSGALMILFILIAVPLCGVGFSSDLTSSFYVPDFITGVIDAKTSTFILYRAVIYSFILIAYLYMFSFHGVLLDDMKPREALRQSRKLVLGNLKSIIFMIMKYGIITFIILAALILLFDGVPDYFLSDFGENLPKGYEVDILAEGHEITDLEAKVTLYRIAGTFFFMLSEYVLTVFEGVAASAFLFEITDVYYRLTGREQISGGLPKKTVKQRLVITGFVMMPVIIGLAALVLGLFYNDFFPRRDTVPVVAHRTGGFLASENSLEGIDEAVKHDCYGSETDIQRTADGYYIINHDNTFKRLTGNPGKPGNMTLEEIKQLRITDTTGSGKLLPVPTLEELLDRGKGRVKLFLELKGATADTRMADDVVALVRERDMVDDVILISLKIDVMEYVEENYPEFDTGVLIFGSIGDTSTLNCDMIIMEMEMSTQDRIDEIHEAGKKAGVWTVNTEEGLDRFLDSSADVLITDNILLEEQVKDELDNRNDVKLMQDRLTGFI